MSARVARVSKKELEDLLAEGYIIDDMLSVNASEERKGFFLDHVGMIRYRGGSARVVRVGNKLYRLFK